MIDSKQNRSPFNIVVIVAALGYFVDIYDLILFGIVKDPSLRAIGVSEDNLLSTGIDLLNMQMWGMLIGGIIWGILGDKKGRLSVLFGTILLYSIANIANGFVQNVTQYAVLRFIAGLGLAGELGVGITLVSEVMTKETRVYGTSIVSAVGIAGAAIGYLVSEWFSWRVAYFVGGGLGLALLGLRVAVYESGMFEKTRQQHQVKRGDFISLFKDRKKFLKYLYCILVGVPVWYTVSILVINSPAFAKDVFHFNFPVSGGKAVMYHYIGASLGSLITGIISEKLRSRKKALFISLTALSLLSAVYFASFQISSGLFYFLIFLLGIAMGYWGVFVTVASEQFGTNIRATVTTTVPNFVRGATVPITLSFKMLSKNIGLWRAGIVVGLVCMLLACFALYHLEETHGKELDYMEQ